MGGRRRYRRPSFGPEAIEHEDGPRGDAQRHRIEPARLGTKEPIRGRPKRSPRPDSPATPRTGWWAIPTSSAVQCDACSWSQASLKRLGERRSYGPRALCGRRSPASSAGPAASADSSALHPPTISSSAVELFTLAWRARARPRPGAALRLRAAAARAASTAAAGCRRAAGPAGPPSSACPAARSPPATVAATAA